MGAEAGPRPAFEVRPSVPVWRSRDVLVRPDVGCTTDPASAAKPINRGARSGAAIRLRQLQAVVVSARYDHQSESRSGALGKRPRTGLLRVEFGLLLRVEIAFGGGGLGRRADGSVVAGTGRTVLA